MSGLTNPSDSELHNIYRVELLACVIPAVLSTYFSMGECVRPEVPYNNKFQVQPLSSSNLVNTEAIL